MLQFGGDPYSGLGPGGPANDPEAERKRKVAEWQAAHPQDPATVTGVLGGDPRNELAAADAVAAKARAEADKAEQLKRLYKDPSLAGVYEKEPGLLQPYQNTIDRLIKAPIPLGATGTTAPGVVGSSQYNQAVFNNGIDQGRRTDALDLLGQAAAGNAPSAAEAQLAQGRDMAIQNAMALGASARGSAAQRLAAERGAASQAGMAMNQYSQQAAQLRAGEMATARQQYSTAAEAAQHGDTEWADVMLKAQAGDRDAQDKITLANMDATLKWRQFTEEEAAKYALLKASVAESEAKFAAGNVDRFLGQQNTLENQNIQRYIAENNARIGARDVSNKEAGTAYNTATTVGSGILGGLSSIFLTPAGGAAVAAGTKAATSAANPYASRT